MWTPEKVEGQAPAHSPAPRWRLVSILLYCTGEMAHFSKIMEDRAFPLQLVEWLLRGVARVILANNPLSGALILGALFMASPWQALLGTVGLLASTLTAVIIGQDSAEIAGGLHGFNGMLVALLMAVFSSAGDWYWWLLLPACLGGATCTFLFSGLAPLLERWDLPVAVFPFNMVIVLFLSCTGSNNPYFPHYPVTPPGAPEGLNHTLLDIPQLLQGVVLGVGQIYACGALPSALLILGAVLIFSPIMCVHALLGSGIGTLVGKWQHAHAHTHMHTHTHACVHARIFANTHTIPHMHTWTHTHTHADTCTNTHNTHTHSHTSPHIAHMHTHTYADTHTHTHNTHTHKPTHSTHAHTHTCRHTHTHSYTYAHMHTHTPQRESKLHKG
ncbi:hypothetical protein ACEWY4_024768 [Coilia grayii]|uniref:Urea transporter n=1 Tax=Coilia grayii TaxID=363190 RepID=A0ABD1IVX4_9TELE